MKLVEVTKLESVDPVEFREEYYNKKPLVISGLAKNWEAWEKWDWEYLKKQAGNKRVGIYNNIKSDAYTPVNKADDYMSFGEYIDLIRKGPAEWRIFLFNIFDHAPGMKGDFIWPTDLMRGFVKKYPMLFVGGEGSITHMHFDIDLSHIVHTQFAGRKRVLLFPFTEADKLYRKPFEVLSLADFSHYYDAEKTKVDYDKFPALKNAAGFDLVLEPGDTLYMPPGYWHHMEYLQSGFAMSLRAMQSGVGGKLKGLWYLAGMRSIDTFLKKTTPEKWYNYKTRKLHKNALLSMSGQG